MREISGHARHDTHGVTAGADDVGQTRADTHIAGAGIIGLIQHFHRQRQDLHRAELKLGQQIGAIARRIRKSQERAGVEASPVQLVPAAANGGDDIGPVVSGDPKLTADDVPADFLKLAFLAAPEIFQARDLLTAARKVPEKELEKLAKKLPIWPLPADMRGVGPLSLAQIVAEAGPIGQYRNPSCLWKRFGLAVENGRAPRPTRGEKLGFAPQRLALMYVVGDNLVKTNAGPYRKLYDERKQYELDRMPDMAPWLAHRRAKRYIEKRLLRELWKLWRMTCLSVSSSSTERPALVSLTPVLGTPAAQPNSTATRLAKPRPNVQSRRKAAQELQPCRALPSATIPLAASGAD